MRNGRQRNILANYPGAMQRSHVFETRKRIIGSIWVSNHTVARSVARLSVGALALKAISDFISEEIGLSYHTQHVLVSVPLDFALLNPSTRRIRGFEK